MQYLGYTASTLSWFTSPSWLEASLNRETNDWYFNLPVSLLTDDYYFVSSRAVDFAGNIQNILSTRKFIFDATPPQKITGLKIEEEDSPLDLKLSWNEINDNLSGIDYYEVSWSGNTTSTTVNIFKLKGQDRENYVFKVRAIDKAGNQGGWSEEVSHLIKLPSVVVSEVQIAGQTVGDEFIELFNPTDKDIDLTSYQIKKKNSQGNESTLVVKSRFKDRIIAANSYLLLAHQDKYIGPTADILWPESYSLTSANTVILYNLKQKIIDKVGWGAAKDFEEDAAPEPEASQSLERKPGYPGGHCDTDNNAQDFFIQEDTNPQNSRGAWLKGWQKRKLLVVDNTENTNSLIDFEVDVEIIYNSAMNSNFSDIRFTDSDGKTLLNYGWDINDDGTEDKEDGRRAKAVVRVPQIPAKSQAIIYMYYSNSAAEGVANLEETLAWFDHFETNRRNEYEVVNNPDALHIETAYSRALLFTWYGEDAWFRPKDFLIKDFLLRTRVASRGYENKGGNFRTYYRWMDDDNLWSFAFNTESRDGIYRRKIVDGTETLIEHYDPPLHLRGNTNWITETIAVYETEQALDMQGLDNYDNPFHYEKSWTNSDVNQAGEIGFYTAGYGASSYIDYLYVRQNTKPRPKVFEESEGYIPITLPPTPYPEFPGWKERKLLVVDNTKNTNSLIDFEVDVEIIYNSAMNSNFSDIRFTDSDGKTLLNYGWDINDDGTEDKEDGRRAKAVVRVPQIPAKSQAIIYMYYSNSAAEGVANLEETLAWFDHFETNRRNEYEVVNNPDALHIETAYSRALLFTWYGEDAWFRPKDFLIKDFLLRTRVASRGYENKGGNFRTYYRWMDDDNLWSFAFNTESRDGIYRRKIVDGTETLIEHYDPPLHLRGNTNWITETIAVYETEQALDMQGLDNYDNPFHYEKSWTNSDVNQAGEIGFYTAGYGASSYIDYLYVRQNTKPRPKVFEESEGYIPITLPPTPYPEFPGWKERRLLVIDNTSNANDLSDYQIEVEIDYQAEMQSDFSDVRFTAQDGQTVLSYYRQAYTEEESATFWVKIPSVPKYSEVVIYQYYNNPSATYIGNGEEVFEWYDDFETNRSSEYTFERVSWDTQSGQAVIHGYPDYQGYLSPTNLNIKNAYIKTKMLLSSNGWNRYARRGFIDYRWQDEDDYWQFGMDNGGPRKGLHFEKVIDSFVHQLAYAPEMKWKFSEWDTYEIWTYAINHKVHFVGPNFETTWQFIDSDLNQEGKVHLRGDKIDAGLGVYIDYLIVAKYIQPEPKVYFEK